LNETKTTHYHQITLKSQSTLRYLWWKLWFKIRN